MNWNCPIRLVELFATLVSEEDSICTARLYDNIAILLIILLWIEKRFTIFHGMCNLPNEGRLHMRCVYETSLDRMWCARKLLHYLEKTEMHAKIRWASTLHYSISNISVYISVPLLMNNKDRLKLIARLSRMLSLSHSLSVCVYVAW